MPGIVYESTLPWNPERYARLSGTSPNKVIFETV